MDLVQPLLDDDEWSVETIQNALECFTCRDQAYNHWLVCVRKFASINLHPEYTSRLRQVWFIAMQPIKYLIIPDRYSGPIFEFGGTFAPISRNITSRDPTLPRHSRTSNVITYGEHFFIGLFPKKGEKLLSVTV